MRQFFLLSLLLCVPAWGAAEGWDPSGFGDRPLDTPLELPTWFRVSFLDLNEDLADIRRAGKRGLILYFGQDDCPYCRAHLENNWGREDIVAYTRKYFEVIHIDVRGSRTVTDLHGHSRPENRFATELKVNFTPTLLFLDQQGRVVYRLTGYRPPYYFRAALEYVADGHYLKEGFRDYLARAEAAEEYGNDALNASPLFRPPPYRLDRRRPDPKRVPLVVFFEAPRCHPCDVLHGGPMNNTAIAGRLRAFEAVQLDIRAETPVVTPQGVATTARQWARDLGIVYAPTLVFFDEDGREILRISSVIGFYRLNKVLDYILSRGYRDYPSYIAWRDRHKGRRPAPGDAPQGMPEENPAPAP